MVESSACVCVCCLRLLGQQVMTVGPMDGLEFHPLNFSERPEEHRRLDVILHKLSEDIMFRWEVGGVVKKNWEDILLVSCEYYQLLSI